VLAHAVAALMTGLPACLGGQRGGADLGVADDDDVGIAAQGPDGVGRLSPLATEEYRTSLMGMTARPAAAWRP